MSAPLAIALDYIRRGWNPVPVLYREKKPIGTEWQHRVITKTNAAQYFNGGRQNIGVQLGKPSGGLADADLDCPEAIAIAPYILPPTKAIFGRTSARASHWLYTTDLADTVNIAVINYNTPQVLGKKGHLAELRIGGGKTGAQTVGPGSIHKETGEEIAWEPGCDGEPANVDGNVLRQRLDRLAALTLIARRWPVKGDRHDAALALGGFLARAGLNGSEIGLAAEAVARAAGDPEWEDRARAAKDHAQHHRKTGQGRGFPTLAELIGDAAIEAVAQWLGYFEWEEHEQDTGSASPGADPVDLWARFDPPALPRGVLPEVIEDFAFDQGMTMGGDMSGIAVSALAVCATAIPERIRLQVKRHNAGWQESARLWVALVGEISTLKTPIMETAIRPLRHMDAEMARAYERAVTSHMKLPKEERQRADPPKQTRLMLEDVTIEHAQGVIKDSPDGVICYQDELSGWFGSMDKYSSARGSSADRAFWLKAYNGPPHSVGRIGRGAFFIENLSASVLGGIQPSLIRKLSNDGVDDGLLQRLLPIVLRPAVMGRDEAPSPAVDEYEELIEKLRNTSGGALGSGLLKLDDGALAIREGLERRHLELQQCETINRKLAAHIGKYNGVFARLCVVWHCVEHAGHDVPALISEATARRAAGFLHRFLLPHALAFYAGTLGMSDDHDRLTAVAGHILAHRLDRITNRDVQRGNRTMRGLTRREIDAVFDQLDALGWIDRRTAPRPTDPPHWLVNPVVHTRFAEKARLERERRETERRTVSELFRTGPP